MLTKAYFAIVFFQILTLSSLAFEKRHALVHVSTEKKPTQKTSEMQNVTKGQIIKIRNTEKVESCFFVSISILIYYY